MLLALMRPKRFSGELWQVASPLSFHLYLRTCLIKFGSPDFIMEPEIFTQLKKYFQAGGNPEQVFVLVA